MAGVGRSAFPFADPVPDPAPVPLMEHAKRNKKRKLNPITPDVPGFTGTQWIAVEVPAQPIVKPSLPQEDRT